MRNSEIRQKKDKRRDKVKRDKDGLLAKIRKRRKQSKGFIH